ncbi:glutaredoxin [Wallemia mellicola CBS 633.66]|uniref:glutathione peroxidase n=1 Tax=Wallemia mellicola (strain ATCC MYA-4683 / CBS 633.66) TaxID=671144 RepID=I4Y8Q7_WALMC|nr:glutaredoxin [Wallemia mellicola CBS 633.66]EIM20349.1 glutaredoxin [Wallemia mellicola CBS 633.66]|eukprot:XP_006959606.1 glutaredoxin [Wallemia mellicola CBS 633.66]
MSAIAQLVEKTIADNVIAVFSKSYCPFCTRTKNLIKQLPVKPDNVAILELDERPDGADIQAYLLDKTGQRSVPNVFVKQQHIGGNDDFQAAHASGKIVQLLQGN